MNAISLFSGMGGDTLGLQNAGLEVIAYNENNGAAQETHRANFAGSQLIDASGNSNIREIPDAIIEQYRGRGVRAIFAGFPCQGFSQAGKKLPEDPRNTLFREFARFVRIIQPDIILGENVKGILKRETPDHEVFRDIIVREFEGMGYTMAVDLVKCVNYGVPQLRERVLFLGVRRPYPGLTVYQPEPPVPLPSIRHIINFDMTGALKIPDQVNIPELIGEGWENKVLTNMENDEDTNNPHPYLLSKVVEGVTVGTERPWVYKGKTYAHLIKFGKRDPVGIEILDLDKPCKTIISSYDHQPRLFICLRNRRGFYLRPLLVDEAKQIQGFPPDFVVRGNTKQKYTQIGNAVPPPVISAVIGSVLG